MSNTVNVSTTTNQVVITPQSTKTVSVNSGDGTSLTVNQGSSNTITISDNVVNTSLTPNIVNITTPPSNGITVTDLRKTITVSQGSTSIVQVASIGPQGATGPQGSQGPQGEQGPIGSGSDQGISPTNVYLTPTKIICQDLTNINLSGSAYTSSGMFELNWTGSQGEMTMYLPDATDSNNTYRAIRFITNGTYETNTRTYLTPSGSQTLDGSTGFYQINKAYEGIMVWSDGIEWFRIQTKA